MSQNEYCREELLELRKQLSRKGRQISALQHQNSELQRIATITNDARIEMFEHKQKYVSNLMELNELKKMYKDNSTKRTTLSTQAEKELPPERTANAATQYQSLTQAQQLRQDGLITNKSNDSTIQKIYLKEIQRLQHENNSLKLQLERSKNPSLSDRQLGCYLAEKKILLEQTDLYLKKSGGQTPSRLVLPRDSPSSYYIESKPDPYQFFSRVQLVPRKHE